MILKTLAADGGVGAEIHRRRCGGSPAAVRPHREDARVRAVAAGPAVGSCPPAPVLPAARRARRHRLGGRRRRRRRLSRRRQRRPVVGVAVFAHRPAIASSS